MANNIGYMICETVSQPQEMTIIADRNGRVTIEAIMQDLEVKNRNGRWYGKNDFAPQMTCERTTELLKSKNLFGEAGHPNTTDLARQSNIDINNIAHCMKKLWLEGNIVKAHTQGTPNAQGKLFNDLILEGTIPSFSLRALGSVNNTSRGAEVKNIKFITYDWVIYPSHKKAYMQKILGESTQLGNTNFMDEAKKIALQHEGNKFILEESDNGLCVPITNQKVIDYVKTESSNMKLIKESLDFMYTDIAVVDNGRRVMMSDKEGQSFVINLENYISNEIINYCYNK